MPRILVVEHQGDAPAALIAAWLVDAGAELSFCRPWAGDEVPPLTSYDGWLVLGGAMGAYDDDLAPWLPEVKDRIAEAATVGTPVLGICLGHQLVAVATGGRVVKNPAGQRVGVYDVGWTSTAAEDRLTARLSTARRAVQWNSDIVSELPPEGAVLAALADGEIQAARFAPSVWGVQWHPEVDRRVVQSWADGDRQDHLDRGIDTDEVLQEIEMAAHELETAWRPLAESFVAVVRGDQ